MTNILPFPERSGAAVHFCGYLLGRLRILVSRANDPREPITIEPMTQEHMTGTYRALVRIAGDETEYEMTLRPVARRGDVA